MDALNSTLLQIPSIINVFSLIIIMANILDEVINFVEYIGLTPFQAVLVSAMLVTGMYVNWTFNHGHDHDHDHDH